MEINRQELLVLAGVVIALGVALVLFKIFYPQVKPGISALDASVDFFNQLISRGIK